MMITSPEYTALKARMSEFIKDGRVIEDICARLYSGEDDTPVGNLAYRLNVGKHIEIVKTFIDVKGNTYAVFKHVDGLFGKFDVPPNAPVVEVGDMMVVLMKGSTTSHVVASPSAKVLAEQAEIKPDKTISKEDYQDLARVLAEPPKPGETLTKKHLTELLLYLQDS